MKINRRAAVGAALGAAVGLSVGLGSCALRFKVTASPLQWTELMGVQWVDVAAAQDRKPVSLVIQDGHQATGHAGCNVYSGRVDWQVNSLKFDRVGLTRMMCDPESMDTESRYIQALNLTRSARVDKGVLELLGAQGQVLWRFKSES